MIILQARVKADSISNERVHENKKGSAVQLSTITRKAVGKAKRGLGLQVVANEYALTFFGCSYFLELEESKDSSICS